MKMICASIDIHRTRGRVLLRSECFNVYKSCLNFFLCVTLSNFATCSAPHVESRPETGSCLPRTFWGWGRLFLRTTQTTGAVHPSLRPAAFCSFLPPAVAFCFMDSRLMTQGSPVEFRRKNKYMPARGSTLGVNVGRLWCPVIWSNASLHAAVKGLSRCD